MEEAIFLSPAYKKVWMDEEENYKQLSVTWDMTYVQTIT